MLLPPGDDCLPQVLLLSVQDRLVAVVAEGDGVKDEVLLGAELQVFTNYLL